MLPSHHERFCRPQTSRTVQHGRGRLSRPLTESWLRLASPAAARAEHGQAHLTARHLNGSRSRVVVPEAAITQHGERQQLLGTKPDLVDVELQRCSELQHFMDLLQQHGSAMDAMLLSRFITAASKSSRLQAVGAGADHHHRGQLAQLMHDFCALAVHKRKLLRPQQLSNILYGCAKLAFCPGREQARLLLQECLAKVVAFKPRDIATVLWAIAKLQLPPGRLLLHNLLVEASDKLGMFNSQDLANTLWALASLQTRPPDAWLAAYMDVAVTKLRLFRPQELASLLWACSTLCCSPSQQQLVQLGNASARLARLYGPQELAMVLWAFARQRFAASPSWMQIHSTRLEQQLEALSTRGFVNCTWALAALAPEVPLCLFRKLLRRGQQLLPAASVHDAAIVTSALCRMQQASAGRLQVSRAFQRQLFAATSGQQLWAASSQDLSQLAWACAASRLQAPCSWLVDLSTAAIASISSFTTAELAIIGAALSRLQGLELPDGWQQAYSDQAGAVLDRCSAQDLTHIIVALACWRFRPGTNWALEFFDASCHLLPCYSAQQLASTAVALAQLKLAPDDIWVDVFSDAVAERSMQLTAANRRSIDYALGVILHLQRLR